MSRISRISRISLWFLLAACGEGGFVPLEWTGDARLSGRVINAAGEPATARVFLIEDGRGIQSVETDAQGRFFFDAPPVGPHQLFAHAAAAGGALVDINLYGGGENDAGALVLSSFLDFPELVDYRDIDFEERLTDRPGGLTGPLAREVLGRDPAPGHAHFLSGSEVVDVELATGVATVQVSIPQPSSGEVIGGSLLLERTADQEIYSVRRLSGGEPIVLLRRSPRWSVVRWQLLQDGSALFYDAVPFEEDSFRERLVRITDTEVTFGPLLAEETSRRGIDPITMDGGSLYFTSNVGCYSETCAPERWTIYRADLSTLTATPAAEVASVTRELPVVVVPGTAQIAVARRVADSEWIVSRVDLRTGASEDVRTVVADTVRVAGATPAELLTIDSRGSVDVLQHVRGASVTELLRAPELRGRKFDPRSVDHEGWAAIAEEDEDGDPIGVALVEVASAAIAHVSYAELADQVLAPFCIALDDAGVSCEETLLPGGHLLVSSVWTSLGADEGASSTVEVSLDGPPRVRSSTNTGFAGLYPSIRPAGGAVEILPLPDARGQLQLAVGPTGAELSAFQVVTYQGGTDYRIVLGASPDSTAIYYLAPDPLSGRRQLFTRALSGRTP